MLLHLIVIAQYFNSQPHEEADTAFDSASVDLSCISTHSLTKRLTIRRPPQLSKAEDFNSQPHEEADRYPALAHITLQHISTHSLTKRLTSPVHPLLILPVISTHSLTKRLTTGLRNPTDAVIISTHSLTKRLTSRHSAGMLCQSSFQLTASRRG